MNQQNDRARPYKRVPEEARIIGANIRSLRLAAGLSQKEIGRALGISYQQVQKYELGQNRFPLEKLFFLKNFYNVPFDIFFAGIAGNEPQDRPGMSMFVRLGMMKNAVMKKKIEDVLQILLA